MENIKLINRWLKEKYGSILDGRAKWKLVFSEGQFEKRHATVERFTPAGIYLGTDTGVQVLKKYSYINERWILEELVFIDNNELIRADKSSYEPRWVFENKDGNYQIPNQKAVQFLVESILKKREELNHEKRNEEDDYQEYDRKKKIARKENYEILGGDAGISEQLFSGEAVSVQGLRDVVKN